MRAARTFCSTSSQVLVGIERGREERVANPGSSPAAKRSIQVFTHLRESLIAAAMCAWGQPAWWR